MLHLLLLLCTPASISCCSCIWWMQHVGCSFLNNSNLHFVSNPESLLILQHIPISHLLFDCTMPRCLYLLVVALLLQSCFGFNTPLRWRRNTPLRRPRHQLQRTAITAASIGGNGGNLQGLDITIVSSYTSRYARYARFRDGIRYGLRCNFSL